MVDQCACGRKIGTKVFKQHLRSCTAALVHLARDGRPAVSISLIDERGPRRMPIGCTCGTVNWEGVMVARPCVVCIASVAPRPGATT